MTKLLKSITSWINKNGNFSNLLKSRIVLYFLFVVSLVNLYTFISTGNGIYAAIFILVGFLTTFFSKNMIVVMIIALAVSNVLLYGKEIKVDEGFDSMDKIEQEQEQEHEEHEQHEKNESVEKKLNEIVNGKESMETKTTTKPTPLATTKPTTSSSKKPEPTPAQVEKAKADLKGLLELEVKLMQGVTEMQPLLDKAKDTIKSLNENIQSTKSAT